MTYVSIPYHVSASPGAEAEVSIYRVPGGRKLRSRALNITFPDTSNYELHLALYRGIKKLLPTVKDYVGDDTRITDDTPAEWGPDEEVLLWYKNDNTAATKEADILLEGELV